MGIVKREAVIAWQYGSQIICASCGDPGEGKPLTEDDFEETDIVMCDQCSERIQ